MSFRESLKKKLCYTYFKSPENTSVHVIFPSVVVVYLLGRTEFSIDTVFFLSGFSFTNILESRDSRGWGKLFLTPHYQFHLLHKHSFISGIITVENSPTYKTSDRTRTVNF